MASLTVGGSKPALTRTRSLRKPADSPSVGDGTEGASEMASPSRLPVKGGLLTRSVSTRAPKTGGSEGPMPMPMPSASNAGHDGGDRKAAKKSRPVSAILTRSSSARQPPAQPQREPSSATSRPPITTRNRAAFTRPTSAVLTPSTVSRPSTLANASASGVNSRSREGRGSSAASNASGTGHARSKSVATALTATTILRPPSQSSVASSAANSVLERDRNRQPLSHSRRGTDGNGPTMRSAAAAIHSRQHSIVLTSTSALKDMAPPPPPLPPATKPPPSQPFSPSTTATESASRHQPQHHRPAFTAFQQHYTPAKSLAPKPLTATFLAAPTPSKLPANIAASAETSRLQTELLQLHLLHRAGPAASAAWRVSAAGRLRARFDDLAAREAEVALRERGAVEAHNALALRDWGGLEEKLPVLDAVVSAVWSLGEPGGRFARLVRRFEKWAERVADAVAARSDSGARGGQEVVFVSELDAGWRDECEGLSRRLDECRRMLQGLDDGRDRDEAGAGAVGDPSSLEVVLGACRTLVHDMLAELEIMERMQREAVAQEDMWVRGRNRAWAVRDQDTETPRAGAIWRAFSGAGPGGQDARCAWS